MLKRNEKTAMNGVGLCLRGKFGSQLAALSGLFLVIFITGCDITAPRPRMGSLPTPPPGPRFENPHKLGKHSYIFSPFEKNGIVYTCKAGHIDITHLRWNADHTRYLMKRVRKSLMKKSKGFSFVLSLEISKHIVRFTYPENWDELSTEEKKKIADEISKEVGPYLAFNATLWHEILTWFGVHFAGIEPEFNSAFSWEDMYSNLLGTELAVKALEDTSRNYDTAMTLAINNELRVLGVQSKKTAIRASKKMRGKWFKGRVAVKTLKKNLDAGLDDGFVTPILVPGICEYASPQPRPVPTAKILSKYGFSMKYEILPREWEKGKMLRVVYGNQKGRKKSKRVLVDEHFPIIIDYIKKQAVEKYGFDID